MDRIEFIKNKMVYPDFPNDFVDHFIETSLVYDLLKNINQDIKSITEEADPESISFTVRADKDTILYIENLCSYATVTDVYKKKISVESNRISDENICLKMKRTS